MPSTAVFNGPVGLLSSRQMLVSQGKYFSVTNPTPGTAIAYATLTGFSATANGLFGIQNTNPAGGASLYLDDLELIQTATVPTGTLAMRFEVYKETGLVTLTGNVATRTPVQLNGVYPQTTGAVVQSFSAGAATVPAAVGVRRLLDVSAIQTSVAVIHDSYAVCFASDADVGTSGGGTAARAAAAGRFVTRMRPVVIEPNATAWVNMWWVTQAANVPSFEFRLAYAEL